MRPTPLPHDCDHYATLEVSPTALHAEIKASYRRLILKWNPDKNAQESAIKLHMLNEAWEILGDGEERNKYDKKRARHFSPEVDHTPSSFAKFEPIFKERAPWTSAREVSKLDSEQIRRAYIDWSNQQRQSIRSLNHERKRRRFIFEQNLPSWCDRLVEVSPYWVIPEVASREADKLKGALLNELDKDLDDMKIMIENKQLLFEMEQSKLKQLQSELEEGEHREQQRLAAERRQRRAREKKDREKLGREQQAQGEGGTKQSSFWRWFNWS